MAVAGDPRQRRLVAEADGAVELVRDAEDHLGSLERGKIADLVILDADPTADIANARRVRLVMRGGATYGRAELLPRR